MVIDDVFNVTEYLSISLLGHTCLLFHRLAIWFEDSCWMGVQDKWNR
jgi:hypothetical protein